MGFNSGLKRLSTLRAGSTQGDYCLCDPNRDDKACKITHVFTASNSFSKVPCLENYGIFNSLFFSYGKSGSIWRGGIYIRNRVFGFPVLLM